MIARVVVDSPLPHLDRLFDYAVPPELAEQVVAGCRVKVRFAGRLIEAWVIELIEHSDHDGALAPIAKVVSSEPILTPAVAGLARAVADRWAGTVGDVMRLAVPPRQARVEARPSDVVDTPLPPVSDDGWIGWPDGPRVVSTLAAGESPRLVWSALPGHDPARAMAEAALATLHAGRGTIVCVPDVRDLARWDATFAEVLGPGRHVVLSAGSKPAERYRAFLQASRGAVQVVLGTRAAAYAPVRDLGLVAIWDDGDDLYAEPRAPYAHAREVLLLRSVRERTAVLLGGYARSAEAQALVEQGWCADISAEPVTRRRAWAQLDVTDGSVAGGAPARLPGSVFQAIRSADGPVLVQVPRRGYRASLACQTCRQPARCRTCQGPLGQSGPSSPPVCRWCGTAAEPWTCDHCGGHTLRAPVVGHLRTAEEYARAFPGRTVVTSGGTSVLDHVDDDEAIVLATPGAEPPAIRGYALVVLMDTWLMLARDDVHVVEEAHRRWFNALALAREKAPAIAVGDSATLQALVRADPVGLAADELAVRAQTHLPPIGRLAVVDGAESVLTEWAARSWPDGTEVLGPVPYDQESRLVLRTPRREGAALAAALKAASSERSAAKLPAVRVQIDPMDF